MNILMATDGSQYATNALRSAGRILAPGDRAVDVIHIVPKVASDNRVLQDKLMRRGERIAEVARATLGKEGIPARPVIQTGSAARLLIGASLDYDVTVIGAHSRKNITNGWLGPVASRLIEHSSGNVLIGREPRDESGLRILAPVDGSEASLRTLDRMVELIDLGSAEITLIHVVETPWLHGGSEEDWVEWDSEDGPPLDLEGQMERELEREGETVLEEARAHLPRNVAISTLIYRGLPADAILTEADTGDYDVIVIGASGSHDLKHQMLGSVSTKIAWNAPCSVLLIRPGGQV